VNPSAALLLLIATVVSGQIASPSFDELSAKAQQAYDAKHDEEAARLYAEAVRLQPDWAQGWWALGTIAYELDQYPACRDALTRMLALDASAAAGWALLGLCEFNVKEYDPALEHLKKAHMLVPVKAPGGQLLDMANYHLALLLTRQGAFEVAQEVLMHVALRAPNNAEMIFAAGLPSLRMSILPSDVPADQHDVVAMAGRAFWDLATKPPEQADSDFNALVEAHPKFPNVHYFYGTFLGARDPDKCAAEFLEELRINPQSVPARVQLALRYIVEGKPREALKYAKGAVTLSPDSVGSQLALGEALRASGDDAHALSAYQAAEKLDPVSPKIRLYLANAYRALGRADEMRHEQDEYRRLKAEQQNWP